MNTEIVGRVAKAVQKLILSNSPNIGADCMLHAELGNALFQNLGINTRIVVGQAAWRVGPGDGTAQQNKRTSWACKRSPKNYSRLEFSPVGERLGRPCNPSPERAKMKTVVTLVFDHNKPLPNLAALAAERCWKIQGVNTCEVQAPDGTVVPVAPPCGPPIVGSKTAEEPSRDSLQP